MIYKIAPARYTVRTQGFQEFRPNVQKTKYLFAAAGSNPPNPPEDNNVNKLINKKFLEKIYHSVGNTNNIANNNADLFLNRTKLFN